MIRAKYAEVLPSGHVHGREEDAEDNLLNVSQVLQMVSKHLPPAHPIPATETCLCCSILVAVLVL